ncbi:MAG: TetR/AcrR family transcriptional regulator; helix-turn-helix transcriptional regulator, partial [Spirochaetaceae bacterium]|nr:TetR/AcrR family transcriptional regulator; helix-turn-helix transcriptional regulator [Spirochaetaceae bacterium]
VYTEIDIQNFLRAAEYYIRHGIALNAKKIESLQWEKIENDVAAEPLPKNTVSAAVAAAMKIIAKKGPWDVTMEKVAEELRLSKSSVYSHFENKKEMLREVFLNEARAIMQFAALNIKKSDTTEEQLYYAVFSIAHYFRLNPDILHALDYLRTRRLDIKSKEEAEIHFNEHKSQFPLFAAIFENIKTSSGSLLINEDRAEWIFFILINVLMRCERIQSSRQFPNEVFRIMYRYIALGLNC